MTNWKDWASPASLLSLSCLSPTPLSQWQPSVAVALNKIPVFIAEWGQLCNSWRMTGGCSACGAKKQTNNTNTYTKQKLKQQQQQTPASVIVSIKCSSTGGRNKSNQNLHPFACAERLRDHIAQQKLRRTKRIPFYTQKKNPFISRNFMFHGNYEPVESPFLEVF